MTYEVVKSEWTYIVTLPNGERYRVVCTEDGEGQIAEEIRIYHINERRDRRVDPKTEDELWDKVHDELQRKKGRGPRIRMSTSGMRNPKSTNP